MPILQSLSRFSVLFLVLLALSTSGCRVTKLIGQAKDHVALGEPWLAAESYLEALTLNEEHSGAREGLKEVAQAAYEQKLAEAEALSQDEEYERSYERYRELRSLIRDLDYYDARPFEVVDVAKRLNTASTAAAQSEFEAGEHALGERRYKAAVARFQRALELKATHLEASRRLGTAYLGWAIEAEREGQYRDAAERFLDAEEYMEGDWPGIVHERASNIYGAFGSFFIERGACRQAVADLERASRLSSGEWASEEKAAVRCATTTLRVPAFSNETGASLDSTALEYRLADALVAQLQAGASRFLVLGGRGHEAGTAISVDGRLTQVALRETGPDEARMETEGVRSYDCTKRREDGSQYATTCRQEIDIVYFQVDAALELRVAGSFEIVDEDTGERLGFELFEDEARDQVRYAHEFTWGGRPLMIRGTIGDEARLSQTIVNFATARRELKSVDELSSDLVDVVSERLADQILELIDRPQPLPDPLELPLPAARWD